MRSDSRRRQAGQSITEAVVATAILGITIVVALGTIDASIGGGRQAVHQAWAQCMVRETIGAIKGSSWAQDYQSPSGVIVINVTQDPALGSELQLVTVTARDPDTGRSLYTRSFLKANALQGVQPIDGALASLASACPQP
jgi:Tfp pilus assembly protein PilV